MVKEVIYLKKVCDRAEYALDYRLRDLDSSTQHMLLEHYYVVLRV